MHTNYNTCGVSLGAKLPGIFVEEHLQFGRLHKVSSHSSAKGNSLDRVIDTNNKIINHFISVPYFTS